MNDQEFWNIIENSWQRAGMNSERLKAIQLNDDQQLRILEDFIWKKLISYYQKELRTLSKTELTAFIHKLEERIHHIDRSEIQEHTDGGDDGFLYCRCFILAMGKEYYNMIDKTPSKATMDLEAESFGFEAYDTYEKLFKEEFERYTFHSMESCSNEHGWKP